MTNPSKEANDDTDPRLLALAKLLGRALARRRVRRQQESAAMTGMINAESEAPEVTSPGVVDHHAPYD